ncbi:MAG: glucose/arabinose dehydrogenase/sugar phosphate isomerase/epimerase [Rubritalea sp.]|jgi:glucose/arabinose dehydrogenase/sugar phosphate isomerase/epimerase
MSKSFIIALLAANTLTLSAADRWDDVCEVVNIPNPTSPKIDSQVGAVGTLPNGDIITAFHRGEVMVLSKGKWKLWASGLHEPLGMHVENQHSIVVVQRSELTRISDTDQDGMADSYESLCNNWGMSGNYHEFAFGASKAADGDFYVALGTASIGAGVRKEIRGEWNAGGVSAEDTKKNYINATKRKGLQRMYGRVPHRGWVIKINPKTGEYKPIASGLRTPHGVCVTAKGDLYVNDNQGDWLGSSKLYKIEQGKFYGHPASLVWTKGWDRGIPANLKPSDLDAMRSKSVCFLPQGDLANSPTQIIELPAKGFGPYGGDLIMGDMNQSRLVRYLPEMVNGKEQGAVLAFMEHSKLGRGNAKITVGEEGTLYIGKTHLSWAGDSGMIALKYKQVAHLAIKKIKLTEKGFQVTLNEPVDAAKIGLSGESYSLNYHKEYGSKKVNPTTLKASSVKVNGNVIEIDLEKPPVAGQIYDISLSGVGSKKFGKLFEKRFFYTAHQVLTQKAAANDEEALTPDLFAFENAFRRRNISTQEQAGIIKNAGYQGIGSISERGALAKLKAYKTAGLKVYSIYAGGEVTEKGYQFQRQELSESMNFLRGSGAMIEFYIKGDKGNNATRQQAVKMMQEVADLANEKGLRVVIYPHSGNYVTPTLSQATTIAKQANRKNLGVMFNLCHFLKEQPQASLKEELLSAKDLLWGVSTSGAEENGKSWVQLIKPLGKDSYQQDELLKTLKHVGYKGAIGLQCYQISSDPKIHLKISADSYKDLLKSVN